MLNFMLKPMDTNQPGGSQHNDSTTQNSASTSQAQSNSASVSNVPAQAVSCSFDFLYSFTFFVSLAK